MGQGLIQVQIMWDFWWTKCGFSPRTYVFPLSVSFHDFLTGLLNFSALNRRRSGQSLETVKKPFLSDTMEYQMEKKFHFIICIAG
jgi:hypothetical protein